MFLNKKNKTGFTLIELMVVISLIGILSVFFLTNYQAGEKRLALRRSGYKLSQDIRRAQSLAMSSQQFNGTFPAGGYALYFQKNAGVYDLFADCNNNQQYDPLGTAISCTAATPLNPYPEKVDEISLEDNITISALSPIAADNTLKVSFFPPNPTITINPVATTASITLSLEGQSVTVSINAAGVIDIQ